MPFCAEGASEKDLAKAREESRLPPLLKPRATLLPRWKRVLYFAGGILCLVLGIVGWVIPFLSGIPFYVGAAILFGISSPKARPLINRVDEKLPLWIRKKLRRFMKRFDKRSADA